MLELERSALDGGTDLDLDPTAQRRPRHVGIAAPQQHDQEAAAQHRRALEAVLHVGEHPVGPSPGGVVGDHEPDAEREDRGQAIPDRRGELGQGRSQRRLDVRREQIVEPTAHVLLRHRVEGRQGQRQVVGALRRGGGGRRILRRRGVRTPGAIRTSSAGERIGLGRRRVGEHGVEVGPKAARTRRRLEESALNLQQAERAQRRARILRVRCADGIRAAHRRPRRAGARMAGVARVADMASVTRGPAQPSGRSSSLARTSSGTGTAVSRS